LAAQRPVLASQVDRRAHLAEYLALTDDHGLEPARHGQQVLDGSVLVMQVRRSGQVAERQPGMACEQLANGRDAAMESVDLGVNLDPVARAEHEGSSHILSAENVLQQLDLGIAGYHDPLERGYRRTRVAEADDEYAHVPTASAVT